MLMSGQYIRTKCLILGKAGRTPKEKEKASDVRHHHENYQTKMKQYADPTSRAKEHNFKVGDLVYIARMESGKLDSTFRDICYVLLRNTSDSSFELVNTEDGSKVDIKRSGFACHVLT